MLLQLLGREFGGFLAGFIGLALVVGGADLSPAPLSQLGVAQVIRATGEKLSDLLEFLHTGRAPSSFPCADREARHRHGQCTS